MMAPGFRVRLGQPSSRLPIPGITESSTVEWHSAQVMPTLRERVLAVLGDHRALDADDRVELEQRDRGGGALEVGRLEDARAAARRHRPSGRPRGRWWDPPPSRSPRAGGGCRSRSVSSPKVSWRNASRPADASAPSTAGAVRSSAVIDKAHVEPARFMNTPPSSCRRRESPLLGRSRGGAFGDNRSARGVPAHAQQEKPARPCWGPRRRPGMKGTAG